MTRTGKIARLPFTIRQQLNQRLHDGEPAVRLVEWLNSLPEVTKVLADSFGAIPISEQNLSEWKLGDYEDWVAQQELLGALQNTVEDAGELNEASQGSTVEPLCQLLAARINLALRKLKLEAENGEVNWTALHALCNDLVKLRRGEQNAERMRMERERLQLEKERLALERQHMQQQTIKNFRDWSWDEKIKAQCMGSADGREALDALGKIMFGEKWEEARPALASESAVERMRSERIKPNQTIPMGPSPREVWDAAHGSRSTHG